MMRKFHWRNFVFLFMLTFSSLNLKAQSLTFEETVKYIQDKFECCVAFHDAGSLETITQNGRITFYSEVFDIFDWIFDMDWDYSEWGHAYVKGKKILCLNKNELKVIEKFDDCANCYHVRNIAEFHTRGDAEKVFKAFKHLKTLCTPEADPFGN